MPVFKGLNLKTFFYSFYKNTLGQSIFTASNESIMDADWWPFYVVIALFILAIVSPWVFPNKSVSKNRHDNEF